jgi:hypothetical protein
MAFPTVEQVVENSTNTAGTNHTINLPTATSGQLLLIILDKGSTAATVNAHGSLTELLDENVANGLYVAYRWMDGTEPASYTLVTSASTRTASHAYRISGAQNPATQAPVVGTTATGTSATPDPPASATPGSTDDYLFIAFYGAAGEEADDDTWSDTPPTNYSPTPPRQKACGTAGTNLGGMIAAAERQLNTGASQDPGTFAKDVSAAWRAQTVLVYPGPVIGRDDDDTHWSSSNYGFSNIPIAGAAAALSLAVSIANAFNQPAEFQWPVVLQGEDKQEVIAVGRDPVPLAFFCDDDIVPQAAPPAALEESEWRAPIVVVAGPVISGPVWDDQIPSRLLEEEYSWTQPYPKLVPIAQPSFADDVVVQQPVEVVTVEDYWLRLFSIDPPIVGLYAPDPEEIPAGQLVSALDDTLSSITQLARPAPTATLWSVGDDIVPQGAFSPDEDYWLRLVADPTSVVIVDFERGAGGPGTIELPVDEQYWFTLRHQVAPVIFKAFGADDEITQAAVPLPVDEMYWFTLQPQPRPLIFKAFSAEDEIPQSQQGGESTGAFNQRATEFSTLVLWPSIDDLPPQAPLNIVESDWQVYTPSWLLPKPIYLPDPEELPALSSPLLDEGEWMPSAPSWRGAFLYLPDPEEYPVLYGIANEQYWQPFTPQPPTLVAQLWEVGDDIVPQPAPITIEEEDWRVYTPPLVAAQPLYLPDADEWPELVTPPEAPPRRKGKIKRPKKIEAEYFRLARESLEQYYAALDRQEAALKPKQPTPPAAASLTDEMVEVASPGELDRIARSVAAALEDRAKAEAEFHRRRRAATAALLMMSY